jgi:hypothetical protein
MWTIVTKQEVELTSDPSRTVVSGPLALFAEGFVVELHVTQTIR